MFFSVCLWALVFWSSFAIASLPIPKALTTKDRQAIVNILGLGTAVKLTGNPYPIGGYQGVEIGVGADILSTAELAGLGARTSKQTETVIQSVHLVKGLYNNLDAGLSMAPSLQTEEVSSFGGQIRWTFLELAQTPVFFTIFLHGNSTNFQNLIVTSTQGVDLIASFVSQDITLYVGAGSLRAQGRFIGGAQGINSTEATETESVSEGRFSVGLNFDLNKLFLAIQLDRQTQAVYSGKLGMRF